MKKFYTLLTILIVVMMIAMPLSGCSSNNTNTSEFVYELNDDGNGYILSYYNSNELYVTIPSTYNGLPVVGLGEGAFRGCSIISIILPSSIKTINDEAFKYCYRLRFLQINSDITITGSAVFSYCTMTTVEINDSGMYKKIGTNTDSNSYGAQIENFTQSLKIPKSIVEAYTNSYLENTSNYTKTADGDYYIFTKVS